LKNDLPKKGAMQSAAQTWFPTATLVTTTAMATSDGRVEVEILEQLPKAGPIAFRVLETGKEKKGILNHGTPPNPLPSVGDKVRVYREPTSSVANPTYRWSPLQSQPPAKGRRPERGGRK